MQLDLSKVKVPNRDITMGILLGLLCNLGVTIFLSSTRFKLTHMEYFHRSMLLSVVIVIVTIVLALVLHQLSAWAELPVDTWSQRHRMISFCGGVALGSATYLLILVIMFFA